MSAHRLERSRAAFDFDVVTDDPPRPSRPPERRSDAPAAARDPQRPDAAGKPAAASAARRGERLAGE